MGFINGLGYWVGKVFLGRGVRNHCEGTYHKELEVHGSGGNLILRKEKIELGLSVK